jgi:hypothetical protein
MRLYVHLIMSESNNGGSLSQPGSREPKRHNAKLCPFAIRQRIVNALANGDSKRAIARALRVSNNTVTAVAEQEWQQVAARKARIAAQCEAVATKAFDQLNDRLDADTLPPNLLVPIAGAATDKLLALRASESGGGIPVQVNMWSGPTVAAVFGHDLQTLEQLKAKYATPGELLQARYNEMVRRLEEQDERPNEPAPNGETLSDSPVGMGLIDTEGARRKALADASATGENRAQKEG